MSTDIESRCTRQQCGDLPFRRIPNYASSDLGAHPGSQPGWLFLRHSRCLHSWQMVYHQLLTRLCSRRQPDEVTDTSRWIDHWHLIDFCPGRWGTAMVRTFNLLKLNNVLP